jgi:uncharacterized membrane protein YoaK (UPF0700 family)/ABC-type transporter Mla MlaB component
MFVHQAHSFRQQAILAVTLAWVGGYTNLVTVLACGSVTSHMSGITSGFGSDLFSGAWDKALYALFLIFTFFTGAAVSGLCTEYGRRRAWESIYVLPIIVEALLLAAFAFILEIYWDVLLNHGAMMYWSTGLAATAMGLQNATITHISSGNVRTTHVTGVLTDLGHEAVQHFWSMLDRRRVTVAGGIPPSTAIAASAPTAGRLMLLACILATFALGGGLGTYAYLHAARWAMFPPVGFLAWLMYRDLARPIAEIESSRLYANSGFSLPPSLAIYHVRKDHDRHGRVHRLPNLLSWSDRLTPSTKVVVLDLSEVIDLDSNAAQELRALLERFAAQRRHLILSGLNREQLARLNQSHATDLIPHENVCADLELAIARGLNQLELTPVPL